MTLDQFLAEPTERDWLHEMAVFGWPGPNGSSASLDAVMGVLIGKKSPKYEYHQLPANLHDWRYQLGRRLRLPWEWSIPADAAYRDGCLERVRAALVGPWLWLAVFFCHARYVGLRFHAHYASVMDGQPW